MTSADRLVDDKGRLVLQRDTFKSWRKNKQNRRLIVTVRPNAFAILVHPKSLPLEHVIRSTEILLDDLQHQQQVENSSANRNGADPTHGECGADRKNRPAKHHQEGGS